MESADVLAVFCQVEHSVDVPAESGPAAGSEMSAGAAGASGL